MNTFGRTIIAAVSRFVRHSLVIAISISIVWHLVWISAIKIVANPKDIASAKFSKIFFLGPLLSKGLLDVRVAPSEPAFSEKQFLERAMRRYELSVTEKGAFSAGEDFRLPARGLLAEHIQKAIGRKKSVPGSDYETMQGNTQ